MRNFFLLTLLNQTINNTFFSSPFSLSNNLHDMYHECHERDKMKKKKKSTFYNNPKILLILKKMDQKGIPSSQKIKI